MYGWDSSVLLGWLLEDFEGLDMEGIREVAADLTDGKCVIVVSTIIRTEVLPSGMDLEARKKFEMFLKRSNVHEAGLDPRVSALAGELQDHYKRQRDAGVIKRLLGARDAIHLATAIQHEVDEFHTFDDGKKNRKHLGLLGLSGNVAGYRLVVCKPRAGQRRFEGM